MAVVRAQVDAAPAQDAGHGGCWREAGAGVAAMLGLGSAALAALCTLGFGAPPEGAPVGPGAATGLALAAGTLAGSLSGLGLLLAACTAQLRLGRPVSGARRPRDFPPG